MGTFVAADGSTYYGSWAGGAMHGKCVYRPAVADAAGCGAAVAWGSGRQVHLLTANLACSTPIH